MSGSVPGTGDTESNKSWPEKDSWDQKEGKDCDLSGTFGGTAFESGGEQRGGEGWKYQLEK